MEKELIYALISSAIYIAGGITYWKNTWTGKTTPHIFSMAIWLILTGFNVYTLYINEQYYGMIPGILMCISLLYAAILGIRYIRQVPIGIFDYVCLALAILSMIYYIVYRDIFGTIILTIIIDILAFLPTFKKWYLQPWSETILLYFAAAVNQIFTVYAMKNPSPEDVLFWMYLFIGNMAFVLLVMIRRYILRGWQSIWR